MTRRHLTTALRDLALVLWVIAGLLVVYEFALDGHVPTRQELQ